MVARGGRRADRWDRLAASDPGLNRLTSAARAAFGVGAALGIEYLVASALGIPAMVPMMIGAVLTMMASFGVADPTPGGRAVTLLCLPLFLFAGMGVALAVDHWRVLSLVVFVVVMFAAVAVRRFGPRWFNGGMVAFMGYFFALFLLLKPQQLPVIALAVAVATAWSLLLSLVVWPVRNGVVLARMVRGFDGRVRGVADAAAALLADPDAGRSGDLVARLESKLVQVNEAALIIDGQLGTPGAVVDDGTARAVRHALIDDELAARALADSVRLLAACGPWLPSEVRTGVVAVLDGLRTGSWAELEGRVRALDAVAAGADRPLPVAVPRPSGSDGPAPPTVAQVVRRFAAAAQGLVEGHRHRHAARPAREASHADYADDAESGFVPAVQLFAGTMPGSAGTIAEMLQERTGAWWSRLSLTTRQAVQVALATGLAIAAGDAISGQRYYWAVLAAFIAFTGTATAGQTIFKAVNRVLGTMLGLLAAIPLVAVTGHSPAVALPIVLVSIFGAFYLMRVSYALMTFFITLLLGELYAMLGTFTPELMLLRLAETAVGGAIGVAVAAFVLPLPTAVVATAARRALLGQLRTLLEDLVRVLRDPAAVGTAADDLAGASRALDARLHQLLLLDATLLRPAPFLRNGERGRRLMLYTSLAHHARRLARLAGTGGGPVDGEVRRVLTHVVERTVDLVDALRADGPVVDPDRSAATVELLSAVDVADPGVRGVVHELGHLHDALVSLGDAAAPARRTSGGPVPALYGRVRGGAEPVQAVLTLTDVRGAQQDRTRTAPDGSYRLQAAEPGMHLLICTPLGTDAAPVAEWVRLRERASVRDLQIPEGAAPTAAPARRTPVRLPAPACRRTASPAGAAELSPGSPR
ncbi:FUSC family protein [Pseudonocardia kujensis]|uniref:FUSC family protein n=1 Tax=Pseudonocardia kujensis TaxID=1128675 RepID=UPI001E28A5F4|nr:FUSC family protein [Pseudonocardia kujensis]MCE0761601.1 FUSC family protein [Pseudonocardia kujensis]